MSVKRDFLLLLKQISLWKQFHFIWQSAGKVVCQVTPQQYHDTNRNSLYYITVICIRRSRRDMVSHRNERADVRTRLVSAQRD